MKINNINLVNFRNHTTLNIDATDSINIIVGNNGCGKTNLLEAIYFAIYGRFFRANNNTLLIQKDKNEFVVTIEVEENLRKNKLVFYLDETKRRIFINDKEVQTRAQILEYIDGVLFEPSMVDGFSGDIQKRRDLVDLYIAKSLKNYRKDFNRYKKLLIERNKALREININKMYVDTITTEIVSLSHYISTIRNKYINAINKAMPDIAKAISNQGKSMEIVYEPIVPIDDGYEENLRKKYNECFDRDIEAKTTTIGIHKEAYKFMLNGLTTEVFASQAEKRLSVLSFVLASAKIIKNYKMIIMLDDVLSELDQTNKEKLIKYLEASGNQAFITATKTEYKQYQCKFEIKGD